MAAKAGTDIIGKLAQVKPGIAWEGQHGWVVYFDDSCEMYILAGGTVGQPGIRVGRDQFSIPINQAAALGDQGPEYHISEYLEYAGIPRLWDRAGKLAPEQMPTLYRCFWGIAHSPTGGSQYLIPMADWTQARCSLAAVLEKDPSYSHASIRCYHAEKPSHSAKVLAEYIFDATALTQWLAQVQAKAAPPTLGEMWADAQIETGLGTTIDLLKLSGLKLPAEAEEWTGQAVADAQLVEALAPANPIDPSGQATSGIQADTTPEAPAPGTRVWYTFPDGTVILAKFMQVIQDGWLLETLPEYRKVAMPFIDCADPARCKVISDLIECPVCGKLVATLVPQLPVGLFKSMCLSCTNEAQEDPAPAAKKPSSHDDIRNQLPKATEVALEALGAWDRGLVVDAIDVVQQVAQLFRKPGTLWDKGGLCGDGDFYSLADEDVASPKAKAWTFRGGLQKVIRGLGEWPWLGRGQDLHDLILSTLSHWWTIEGLKVDADPTGYITIQIHIGVWLDSFRAALGKTPAFDFDAARLDIQHFQKVLHSMKSAAHPAYDVAIGAWDITCTTLTSEIVYRVQQVAQAQAIQNFVDTGDFSRQVPPCGVHFTTDTHWQPRVGDIICCWQPGGFGTKKGEITSLVDSKGILVLEYEDSSGHRDFTQPHTSHLIVRPMQMEVLEASSAATPEYKAPPTYID